MEEKSWQPLEIKTSERVIEARLYLPEGAGIFPGVVFYHGRASSMKGYLPIAERLPEENIASLAFNFSADEITRRQEEGEKAYLVLKDNPRIDSGMIGICGSSMGAHTAVMVALENPVLSLVLRAPAAYTNSDFDDTEDSQTLEALRQFTGSLLIIQSEKDERIPTYLIDLFLSNAVKAKSAEKYIIRGANHFLNQDPKLREELKNIVVKWFKETL